MPAPELLLSGVGSTTTPLLSALVALALNFATTTQPLPDMREIKLVVSSYLKNFVRHTATA